MGQDVLDRRYNLGGRVQAGAGCGQDGSSFSLGETKIVVSNLFVIQSLTDGCNRLFCFASYSTE